MCIKFYWFFILALLVLVVSFFYPKPFRPFVKRVDKKLRDSFQYRPITWSIAIPVVPVALTITIALLGSTSVVEAFDNWCTSLPFDWHAAFRVAIVLVGSLAFIVTQYVRVRGDADLRDNDLKEQDKQIRAYAVLPSLEFMFNLKSEPFDAIDKAMERYHSTADQVDLKDLNEEALNAESDQVSEALRVALSSLSSLAEDFGSPRRNRREDVRYGASIMLAISQPDIKHLPVEFRSTPEEEGKLRFLPREAAVEKLHGVLVLNDDLLLPSYADESKISEKTKGIPPYPELALPVRKPVTKKGTTEIDISMVLPGGPHAILGNVAKWVNDTRFIADSSDYRFDGEVSDKLKAYFCEGGEGSNIQSLFSMRIGTKDNPIGVINFDANVPDFLGDRSVHYEVFSAFIRPSIILLRPAVSRYAEIWWKLLALAEEKRRTVGPEQTPKAD